MPDLECPYFVGFEQNLGSQIWQNWSLEFGEIQLTELSNILVKYSYAEFRMSTFRRIESSTWTVKFDGNLTH